MSDMAYEKGQIKVVWVSDDPEKIYSKMFDSEKKAEEFARSKTQDYIIFALEKQVNMEEFSWRILPYGRYKLYKALVMGLRGSGEGVIKKFKSIFS